MEHRKPISFTWRPSDYFGIRSETIGGMASSVPTRGSTFTEKKWGGIAQNGDKLISIIGNMTDAAHCYISLWRKERTPTTLTSKGSGIYKNLVGEELFNFSCLPSTQGALGKSHGAPIRFPKSPYPPGRDSPIRTLQDLWGDLVDAVYSPLPP